MNKKYFLLLPLVLASVCFGDEAVERAVREYLAQVSPDQLARSDAYFQGGYWLQLWNLIYGLALASLLMRTGWSVQLRNLAVRCTRFHFLRSWIYFIEYFLFTALLSFPLTVYQDFFREHKYGLSNLTFLNWVLEQLKGLAIALVLGGLFGAVIYALVNRLRETWWAWATAASIVFLILVGIISPVFLAPVFNTYVPLPAGEVRESVLTMARSNGVPAEEVYTFDASKQSKRISANVSGLFGTSRISLNDNLLQRTSPAEIRAVMGHEIGHYVLNHALKSVTEIGLVFLLGFYFLYVSFNWFVNSYGANFGLTHVGDLAGVPIFSALFSLYLFFATPVMNTIVRTSEAEADMFGLNLAREPDGAAKVALKLSEYRKLSPGFWEEVFFYDHPSGENRIRMAMKWKLENGKTPEGESQEPR